MNRKCKYKRSESKEFPGVLQAACNGKPIQPQSDFKYCPFCGGEIEIMEPEAVAA